MNKITRDRLASFARLWGKVYLFHPALEGDRLDLVPATTDAIRAILASRDKDAYRDAIATFLGALKDPSTKLKEAKEHPTTAKWDVPAEWHWTNSDVGVLRVSAFDAAGDGRAEALAAAIRDPVGPAGLVIDMRGTDWRSWSTLTDLVRNLIPRPIARPGFAWRRHSGWATEGTITSGGYYSSLEMESQALILPSRGLRNGPLDRPIVILATTEYEPISVGTALWFAGLGGLVLEGEAAVAETIEVTLAGGLTAIVRVSEWVNPDGSHGFEPAVRVKTSSASGDYISSVAVRRAVRLALNPKQPRTRSSRAPALPKRKAPTQSSELPDAAGRIYAWIKTWNVIKYFFPLHQHTDRPWDESLSEFLPRFAAAKSHAQYALAAAEACTWMDDTHAGASSPGMMEVLGTHVPKVQLRRIEDRFVVTAMDASAEAAGLLLGDIITSVDGVDAEEAAQRLRPLIAHSTEQSFFMMASSYLLAGGEEPVTITVRRSRSSGKKISLERAAWGWRPSPDGPTFKILPQGYGYVDLVHLDRNAIDDLLRTVKDTSALIIDIRGYPKGAMFTLAPRLTSKKVNAALFSRPEVLASGDTSHEIGIDRSPVYRFMQTISPSPRSKYEKPIVVLIDERAISHAEHSCLFVEATSDVTFVGTPTTGANGDVTVISLPGKMFVRFTGHEVRHADGRQLQRVGIIPDLKVAPTIQGVRAGRDEVLEAAIAHLDSKGHRSS